MMAISGRWSEPARSYKEWYQSREHNDFGLGSIEVVAVDSDLWVTNMVAQRGLKPVKGIPPNRYEALEQCLQQVAAKAQELKASVHMPRIGCGLAGGTWEQIEPILTRVLCKQGISVTIYEFPR